MNENQRAAFLQAQAACAIIEALATAVERISGPGPDTRGRDQVLALIDKYGIGHNAAITFLGDGR